MRWLVHGNVHPAAGDALRRHGHEARTIADVGLAAGATTGEILAAAHARQLDLLTADAELADAAYQQPTKFGRSMVLLNVGNGDVEQDDGIDRLFTRYKHLTPGRLYTVTPQRVKIRQLPARH